MKLLKLDEESNKSVAEGVKKESKIFDDFIAFSCLEKCLWPGQFLAKSEKSLEPILVNFQKGSFLAHFWPNANFYEKSGSVSFLHVWFPDLMQKNQKNS